MLIFNCTKAFAAFIEPKKTVGSIPLVGPPPAAQPADDGPHLIDLTGKPPQHVQQWLVHLVRIRRRPCVVAMDIATRYAMVFTGLTKGDAADFLNRFSERLLNELAFSARGLGMMADFDAMLAQYVARHGRFQFCLRVERSTQAHLKDVVWQLEYDFADNGCLPSTHEECMAFDRNVNQTPRTVKGRKACFFPDEEMLCEGLASYAGLTREGEIALRERLREKKSRDRRERWIFEAVET